MSGISILQVAHDHPDWTPGGTEIVAHELARALDARGDADCRFLAATTSLHRPGVAPGQLGAHGRDFLLQTGAYDRFTMTRMDGDAWVAALGRVLDTVRPQVVHLHGLDRIGAEVIPAVRRLAPDCRIVLTLHDYQLICANDGLLMTTGDGARCRGAQPDRCRRCFPELTAARHALRRAHLQAVLSSVDAFVAPSAFLKARFVAWGLEADRIAVVPNAVAREADRAGVAPRARRDRFAFFGNVARHKGALVLLDAAARARLRDRSLRVAVHGGLGLAEEAFRDDFAAALRIAAPTAQHFGPYEREDVLRLMRGADWIVVPSLWWENAPLVIEEARAAGLPVICSGIGGMAERVTDGIDGLHVPPGDAAALAETMLAAAADPDLWERLAGATGPVRHDAFVAAHMALYQQLMATVSA